MIDVIIILSMRRRRNGGIGIFGFIIIMTILGELSDIMPIMVYGFLMPLGVFGVIGYGLYKLIKTMFADTDSPRSYKYSQSNANRNYSQSQVKNNQSNSYVKNAKNDEIDKVLSRYFKKNVSLVLFDEISIDLQGGSYTTVDNLYISYKGEKISQLKEYKSYYPETYERVIEALAKLAKKAQSVKPKEEKKEEPKEKEVKIDNFSEAEKFIDQINSLNRDLYNEEITNGLYQTCELLKQIDIVDRQDGRIDPKLNKLYEYYLPILTGILTDYKRLCESPIKGEEFKKCETQLIKTIKLINEALKTIFSSLHEADYMNLNADINTLQSLLKQDGLVDYPFGEDK